MSVKPGIHIAFAIWAAAFTLTAVAIGFVIDAPRLLLLERHHARTSGTVTRVIPNSHGQVVVRYSVKGLTYEQSFGPSSRHEGETVPVYYYPQSPDISEISDPSDVLTDNMPAWIATSLLFSFFVLGCVFALRRPSLWGVPTHVIPPKVICVAVAAVGVLSVAHTIQLRGLNAWVALWGSLQLAGIAFLLQASWPRGTGWRQMVRSGRFWIAMLLFVAGFSLDILTA